MNKPKILLPPGEKKPESCSRCKFGASTIMGIDSSNLTCHYSGNYEKCPCVEQQEQPAPERTAGELTKSEREVMRQMIKLHLCDWDDISHGSVKYYAETKKISGGLLLAIERVMRLWHEYIVKRKATVEKAESYAAQLRPTMHYEREDAERWLSEKKDIWNHPMVSDRTDKNSYEVADLMAEFASQFRPTMPGDEEYCHNCSNQCFNETMGCKNYVPDFKCHNFLDKIK